jgi:hypothetical protein
LLPQNHIAGAWHASAVKNLHEGTLEAVKNLFVIKMLLVFANYPGKDTRGCEKPICN